MKAPIAEGRYVVAVSGGVDSMVLLDLLSKQGGVELIVAHFNHGIRQDSAKDEELVKKTAQSHRLPLEIGYGKLGPNTSEDRARTARYEFLESLKQKHGAGAVVTAHHQDDMIETALLNLLRGSGRRGISAIADSGTLRPLLKIPKAEIVRYAVDNQIKWREDSSNSDERYLRNYLRKRLLDKLTAEQRRNIINNIDKVAKINKELNREIATLSHEIMNNNLIDRAKFIALPLEVGNEVIMSWLRGLGYRDFDKNSVNRLSLAIRTALTDTEHRVHGNISLQVGKKSAHFTTTD